MSSASGGNTSWGHQPYAGSSWATNYDAEAAFNELARRQGQQPGPAPRRPRSARGRAFAVVTGICMLMPLAWPIGFVTTWLTDWKIVNKLMFSLISGGLSVDLLWTFMNAH